MVIYLDLLVALIGLILMLIAAPPKVSSIGGTMFFCGLLTFLLCMCNGAHSVTLLK